MQNAEVRLNRNDKTLDLRFSKIYSIFDELISEYVCGNLLIAVGRIRAHEIVEI